MAKDSPIWDVEHKYITGGSLNADDLRVAEAALDAENVPEQIIACEALLRGDSSEELKARATQALETLCEEVLNKRKQANESLFLAILLVQPEKLLCSSSMKNFVYAAALSSDSGWRTNNVLVLERLARLGERKALELLEMAQTDENELVRRNAAYFLQRLREK